MGHGLKIFLKPQLLAMVLRKIVKPWSLILVLRLFLKLLKPQSPTVVFNTKKKVTWMIMWIENTTMKNILRWVLFLPFFSTNGSFWT